MVAVICLKLTHDRFDLVKEVVMIIIAITKFFKLIRSKKI